MLSDNETLVAAYSNGSHNPRCPSTYYTNVGSIITLNCDLDATWSESEGKGNASEHFKGLLVNPVDGCIVCVLNCICYFI